MMSELEFNMDEAHIAAAVNIRSTARARQLPSKPMHWYRIAALVFYFGQPKRHIAYWLQECKDFAIRVK